MCVLARVLSNAAATLPPRGLTPTVQQRIDRYGSAEEDDRVFAAAIPRYFDAAGVSPHDIE